MKLTPGILASNISDLQGKYKVEVGKTPAQAAETLQALLSNEDATVSVSKKDDYSKHELTAKQLLALRKVELAPDQLAPPEQHLLNLLNQSSSLVYPVAFHASGSGPMAPAMGIALLSGGGRLALSVIDSTRSGDTTFLKTPNGGGELVTDSFHTPSSREDSGKHQGWEAAAAKQGLLLNTQQMTQALESASPLLQAVSEFKIFGQS